MSYKEFKEIMLQFESFTEEEIKDMYEAEMMAERADAMVACGR